MQEKELLVFPLFYRNISGGAVQAALRLMRGVKREYNIAIVTPKTFSISDDLEREGILVCKTINIQKGNVSLAKLLNPFFLISFFIKVKNEIIRNPKKCIIINNDFCGELVTSIVFPKIKRIFIARGGDYNTLTGKILSYFSFKFTTYFIAVSISEYDKLRKLNVPENKIKLIFDGIELINKPGPKIFNKQRVIIACVGFYNDNKNQLLAVETVKLLRERGFNVYLNLYGGYAFSDKNYIENLQKIIQQYQLDEFIKICGFKKSTELFSTNDILLSVSKSEGFGLSVLEAMAYMLPVISTDSGGVKTLINNLSEGIIVDSFSAVEIANNIIKILENDQLRNSLIHNARERYESLFLIERTIENFKIVLKNVTNHVH